MSNQGDEANPPDPLDKDWVGLGLTKIYSASWELGTLLELDSFREYAGKKFELSFEGYLFLTEITILHLIHCVEMAVNDDKLSEMVTWGDKTIQDSVIQRLKEENPNFYMVFLLNKNRRNLAKLRGDAKIVESKIREEFSSIKETLTKLSTNFLHGKKVIAKNKKFEKHIITTYLMLNQNYIDHGHPQGIFYYTAPRGMEWEYCDYNPRNARRVKQILLGYSSGLAFLYNELGVSKEIQNKLMESKSWLSLHMNWVKIRDEHAQPIEKNVGNLLDMALYGGEVKQKKPKKMEIKTKDDLVELFRGRKLRSFRREKNYTRTWRIFTDLFFGEIDVHRTGSSKVELIELTEDDPKRGKQCTYAIYSPLRGTFWNASEWYIFYQLTPAKTDHWQSDFQFQLYYMIESLKARVEFGKFKVPYGILKEFIRENDPRVKKSIKQREKMASLNGFFAELLAFEFFSRKNKKALIKWRVKNSHFGDTDADILIIHKKKIEIVQVKLSTKSFDSTVEKNFLAVEKGLPHFMKANKLPLSLKVERKVFFAKRDYRFTDVIKKCKKIGAEPVFFEKGLSSYDRETQSKLFDLLDLRKNIEKIEKSRARFKEMTLEL